MNKAKKIIITTLSIVMVGGIFWGGSYILGNKSSANNNYTGESIEVSNADSHKEMLTEMPITTPVETTTSVVAAITSKDLYFDDNEKLVYTDKLVEYVKSFDSMKDLTDEQIKKVIESQKFKELTGLAVMYGNPVGAVDLALNSLVTDSLIRDALNGLTTVGVDTTAGNTGGGKDSELETSDNNKGGSEDNEVVADEDFVTPETDMDNNEIDDFEFVEQDTEPETTTTQEKEDNSKGYTCTYYGYVETMYARDNVNVRKGPSTDYEKVSSLYKGDEVKVIGVCNETGWYCIVKDRAAVFVSGKYLSKTKPIIKNPVTDTTEEPTTSNIQKEEKHNSPYISDRHGYNVGDQVILDSFGITVTYQGEDVWMGENSLVYTAVMEYENGDMLFANGLFAKPGEQPVSERMGYQPGDYILVQSLGYDFNRVYVGNDIWYNDNDPDVELIASLQNGKLKFTRYTWKSN